jgi:hypothetical protein
MAYSAGLLVSLGLLAGIVCAAPQDATHAQLTGRELFYNTASAHASRADAAPPAKPEAHSKPKAKAVSKNQPRPAAAPPAAVEGANVIPASAFVEPAPSTPPAPALGLKYTVLKLVNNEYFEVAPDTVFHAGDRVRFSVEPNGPGYLYIVKLGTSGMWEPVFPSAEVADASNRVDGWRSYVMPPMARLAFDEQTGAEKIFIVLSRVEEPDLERLMFSLKNEAKPAAAPQQKPAAQSKTLVAGLSIDDATVGRLREAYARDLIIEKVDDDTPGPKKEKAVYVVNPTGSSDSRVVAEIELVHK